MNEEKAVDAFYDRVSAWYDKMYVDRKIYENEAMQVQSLVEKYKMTDGNYLLDLACGSGPHIEYWVDKYHVVGLDNNMHMLARAHEKWPQIMFVCGNMFHFSNLCNFDIVTCLYGSIGYAENIEELEQAVACVSKCMKQGGVFILTPGIGKDFFEEKVYIKSRNLKEQAFSFRKIELVKRVDENRAVISMNHRIVKDGKVEKYKFDIPISLFSREDYISALERNGFSIVEEKNEAEFRMGAFVSRKNE